LQTTLFLEQLPVPVLGENNLIFTLFFSRATNSDKVSDSSGARSITLNKTVDVNVPVKKGLLHMIRVPGMAQNQLLNFTNPHCSNNFLPNEN
jgi:pseudouridine-5'-phosphate glycosidase